MSALFNQSCRQCRDRLLEYSAGVLPPFQQNAVDAHLSTCSSCRQELEFWRSLGDIVTHAEAQLPADTGALAGWSRLGLGEAALAYEAVAARPAESGQPPEEESTMKIRSVPLPTLEFGSPPSGTRGPAHPTHRGQALRQLVATAVAGAAVLLVVIGSIALFQDPQLFGGSDKLLWKQIALPPGVLLAVGVRQISPPPATTVGAKVPNAVLYVSPDNGEVAYICQTLSSSRPRLWRSVDAGQHWVLLPAVPVNSVFDSCSLETDESDPLTVLVALTQSATSPDLSYMLTDGAQDWQPASNGIESFATWHQEAFVIKDLGAIPGTVLSSGSPPSTTGTRVPGTLPQVLGGIMRTILYASTDLNHSWKEIDSSILQQAGSRVVSYLPDQVWVQPETGALLVLTNGGLLWTSSDQGEHWRQITFPAGATAATGFDGPGPYPYLIPSPVLVQQPVGTEPFHICAFLQREPALPFSPPEGYDPGQESSNVDPFYCSRDGGQIWNHLPESTFSLQGNPQPVFQPPNQPNFSALLADGSLVLYPSPPNRDIVRVPADATDVTSGYVIGSNPAPTNPNDIPGGLLGPTAEGAVFWQPYDAQTVYVASYAYQNSP